MWRCIGNATVKLHVFLNCITLRALYTRGRSHHAPQKWKSCLTSSTGSRPEWWQKSYRQDSRRVVVRFQADAFLRNFQSGSGHHPFSYSLAASYKAAGAWSWPLVTSGVVKNDWSHTSIPPYALMLCKGNIVSSLPEEAKRPENSQLGCRGWNFMQCLCFRICFVWRRLNRAAGCESVYQF